MRSRFAGLFYRTGGGGKSERKCKKCNTALHFICYWQLNAERVLLIWMAECVAGWFVAAEKYFSAEKTTRVFAGMTAVFWKISHLTIWSQYGYFVGSKKTSFLSHMCPNVKSAELIKLLKWVWKERLDRVNCLKLDGNFRRRFLVNTTSDYCSSKTVLIFPLCIVGEWIIITIGHIAVWSIWARQRLLPNVLRKALLRFALPKTKEYSCEILSWQVDQ